jgi:hypothetical protein
LGDGKSLVAGEVTAVDVMEINAKARDEWRKIVPPRGEHHHALLSNF